MRLVLACTRENMRACAWCGVVCRRTCVHEARAGVHTGGHACTRLALACTPENMHARVQCWHTRWRTCVHDAWAGVHAGGHPCRVCCWCGVCRACPVEVG